MASARIAALAQSIIDGAREKKLKITTAESCTGGMIASAITDISGSSVIFDFGFVTYANEAKADLLYVPSDVLERHGAVSAETARAMAEGALARARADIAVSVTGIAGPDGGTKEKPVGLVWFGLATRSGVRAERRLFAKAPRAFVRTKSVETALMLVKNAIDAA